MNTFLPKLRPSLLFTLCLIQVFSAAAQAIRPDPAYRLLKGESYVQSKNYYLITLMDELTEVNRLLSADAALLRLSQAKFLQLQAALSDTAGVPALLDALQFSPAEIDSMAARLKALYTPGNALGKLVKEHLLPSGTYILFQQQAPADVLAQAWRQDAEGINFALSVYAGGAKPNYPLIDSSSLDIKDPKKPSEYARGYKGLLHNAAYSVATKSQLRPVFYRIPLNAALLFLNMNERNQVADFEPMAAGENRLAAEEIADTHWNKYPYTLILVPGAGPDDPEMALSAEGMVRCQLAATQYRKGLAPFLVVSGGKVHPYKTRFCEATEMKQYLVNELHIPPAAILIEPHARHTTTNMRNTVRMMFRYGMPMNKPAITCTTRGQSNMIEKTLIARCQRELQAVPYKNGNRLSESEVEFYPSLDALHLHPKEPMDP